MINFLFLLTIFRLSQSECTNGDGCSMYGSCDVEFVDDAVYGCGGIWEDDGVESGAYLCGEGYTICADDATATDLGLTNALCTSTDLIDTNYFYTSLQGSSDATTCDGGGNNNIFGCGSGSDDGFIDFNTDCTSFGGKISTVSAGDGNGWKYGWQPWGDNTYDELIQTTHLTTQTSSNGVDYEHTNVTVGGVLCCKYNESSISTTSFFSSISDTMETGCDGCSGSAVCDIEFSEYVFGCSGSWSEMGIDNAEYLCGENYMICSDGDYAEELGLTEEDCLALPDDNYFYASSANSLGNLECQDNTTANMTMGYNDIFGCGNSNSENNWICTTENYCGAMDCGVFTSQISWNSAGAEHYGWNPWGIDDSNELDAVTHSGEIGGVLCCIIDIPTTTGSEPTMDTDTYGTDRTDGVLSIYSSITIIYLVLSVAIVFM
eukprot:152223_1